MNERPDSQSLLQSESTLNTAVDGLTDSTADGMESENPTNGRNSRDASLRQILRAMVAFREGDFSVRLPTDWSGLEGRVAEAFNQTIAQEERIAQEISRVSVLVGKE